MQSYVLVDMNNLAHTAFHALGPLTHKGQPTQVIYGVLQKLAWYSNYFRSMELMLCFDLGHSVREKIYPEYKAKRKEFNSKPEIQENRKILFAQLKQLRKEILPELGFTNVFASEGYEADDIMAAIVRNCKDPNRDLVIVSSDKDMYQLLDDKRVGIWNNRMPDLYRYSDFQNQYDIQVGDWKRVKAIAGCTTDGIAGVVGVGETTAIKYLNNQLKKSTKAWQKITSKEGKDIEARNLKLVELPYPGTPDFHAQIKPHEVTIDKWHATATKYGMKSLHEFVPALRGY